MERKENVTPPKKRNLEELEVSTPRKVVNSMKMEESPPEDEESRSIEKNYRAITFANDRQRQKARDREIKRLKISEIISKIDLISSRLLKLEDKVNLVFNMNSQGASSYGMSILKERELEKKENKS